MARFTQPAALKPVTLGIEHSTLLGMPHEHGMHSVLPVRGPTKASFAFDQAPGHVAAPPTSFPATGPFQFSTSGAQIPAQGSEPPAPVMAPLPAVAVAAGPPPPPEPVSPGENGSPPQP